MKGEQIEKVTNGAVPGSVQEPVAQPEATIDQVRDLLFGGAQRSIETSLAGLREEMRASLEQIQAAFAKELSALQAKVNELEQDTEQKRLASHRDIGAAISELGATISGLGSGRTGKG